MADVDIEQLLFLRTAKVRQLSAPGVPLEVAGRLCHRELAQPIGGSIEITERGLRYLDSIFLLCAAAGCDGILRRWEQLSDSSVGCDPQDPELSSPSDASGGQYYIKCRKCGSLNLLGKDAPVGRRGYVVTSVFN